MAKHLLGSLDQIPPGEGKTFVVDGVSLAVFRTREGGVFATQAYCPHRNGPLADGLTDGMTVVCPLHDRIYSLATGEGVGHECSVAIYPAEMHEAQLFVEVPHPAGQVPETA